jgi:hypothetical protein
MPYYSKQMAQDILGLKATQLNEAAEILPHGDEREALLHRARKIGAASLIIDRWLSSPSLRPPR